MRISLLKLKEAILKVLKSGFAHVFLANSFNKVITFTSGIILVRLLTKEDYGVYSYA